MFDYVIIEGINLTNYNLDKICDVKILVKADNNLRYSRVLKRDIYQDKESIIDFLNENNKIDINEHGYYIIENNGSLQELENNIRKVEYKIKHLNK
jgi:uridine kinase